VRRLKTLWSVDALTVSIPERHYTPASKSVYADPFGRLGRRAAVPRFSSGWHCAVLTSRY